MKSLSGIIFTLFMVYSATAQIKITAKPGEVFHINELGSVVLLKDGVIKVEHVLPVDTRPEKYRDIEIKTGDEILMVNGKKVSTPGDIESIYNEMKIGDAVKLGIRRKDTLMILNFDKADPEMLPERKIMRMKVEAGPDGPVKKIIDESGGEHLVKGDSVLINGEKISVKDIENKKMKIKVDSDD